MKKQFLKSAVATAVLGAAMVAAGGAAAGTIANTKHNLGSAGTGPNSVQDTGEICIFCHTPHGGDNGAPVPLWNKVLTTATFKTYDQLGTSTYDAAQGPIGSVTMACLTCHDGTQAIDNIINAPGSGGYDPTGGGATGLAWTWNPSTDGSLDATGTFTAGPDAGGTTIFNLGTDLTNDHPVSMQYGGGGYSASNPSGGAFASVGPTRDQDFAAANQIAGVNRWYIDNTFMGGASAESTTGAFDKWDFKLYTRDTSTLAAADARGVAYAAEPEPFVECGSCHDPHMETTTFLRIDPALNGGASNNSSQVCLACHTK